MNEYNGAAKIRQRPGKVGSFLDLRGSSIPSYSSFVLKDDKMKGGHKEKKELGHRIKGEEEPNKKLGPNGKLNTPRGPRGSLDSGPATTD
jgi:hypothetical protein